MRGWPMRSDSKMSKKEFSLPQTSAADLMGKQSVRATFRLTEACIDAISILSAQLGIKQKSLFDHLMEDAESLVAIAREAESAMLEKEKRTQKTFVISKKSIFRDDETLFWTCMPCYYDHGMRRK